MNKLLLLLTLLLASCTTTQTKIVYKIPKFTCPGITKPVYNKLTVKENLEANVTTASNNLQRTELLMDEYKTRLQCIDEQLELFTKEAEKEENK